MNKEAMLAVADVIEYAGRFDLGTWISAYGRFTHDPAELWEKCDTVGCYAGWVAAWADRSPSQVASWITIGREELDLTKEQANRLFLGFDDFYHRDDVKKVTGKNLWELPDEDETENAVAAAKLLRAIAKGKVAL